jgi:hypothetical protein
VTTLVFCPPPGWVVASAREGAQLSFFALGGSATGPHGRASGLAGAQLIAEQPSICWASSRLAWP